MIAKKFAKKSMKIAPQKEAEAAPLREIALMQPSKVPVPLTAKAQNAFGLAAAVLIKPAMCCQKP